MILTLGLISILGVLPQPCWCGNPGFMTDSLPPRGQCESLLFMGTLPQVKRNVFRGDGWGQPIEHGPQDVGPPLHIPPTDLGPDVTGRLWTRGRRERWQLDTWQVVLITPLDLNPDWHVHLNYRLPLRNRHRPSFRRSRDGP